MPTSDRAPAPPPAASQTRAKAVGGPVAMPSTGQRYPTLSAGNESLRLLLVEVLRKRGTSQAELAEDLQVPRALVTAWVCGTRTIPGSVFLALQHDRLAEALLYAAIERRRANNDNSGHR
jgi:hypothetical protein